MSVLASCRDVPRAEFDQALERIAAATKPGRVYTLQVGHADACPCRGNRAPMPACTCETVDLALAELQ